MLLVSHLKEVPRMEIVLFEWLWQHICEEVYRRSRSSLKELLKSSRNRLSKQSYVELRGERSRRNNIIVCFSQIRWRWLVPSITFALGCEQWHINITRGSGIFWVSFVHVEIRPRKKEFNRNDSLRTKSRQKWHNFNLCEKWIGKRRFTILASTIRPGNNLLVFLRDAEETKNMKNSSGSKKCEQTK